MSKIPEFEHLVDAFKSLPGVGTKNAKKWAHYLLEQDKFYVDKFVNKITEAYSKIKRCAKCSNLSRNELCSICENINRDTQKLCVVSNIEDLERIESSKSFFGLYHITQMDYDNKIEHKNLLKILDRVKNDNIKEVIVATSFSNQGEAVAAYICNLLQDLKDVSIYRIGFGIPLNGAIDYTDDETLNQSFSNKRKIN